MISANNIQVVLVRPSLPANIGMVARSMLNFCLTNLVVVSPKNQNWKIEALAASTEALNYLNIKQVNTIAQALDDSFYSYALTARNRDLSLPSFDLELLDLNNNDFLPSFKRSDKKLSFVFGNEANGLSNSELAFCDATVFIKTNNQFSSLNIACASAVCFFHISRFLQNNTKNTIHTENKVMDIVDSSSLLGLTNTLVSIFEKSKHCANFAQIQSLVNDFLIVLNRAKLSQKELNQVFKIIKILTDSTK